MNNMTNIDKIRSMKEEELYDFISKIDIYRCTCPAVEMCHSDDDTDFVTCKNIFIKWLKQEVNKDEIWQFR